MGRHRKRGVDGIERRPAKDRLPRRALERSPDLSSPHDPAEEPRFLIGETSLTSREIDILLLICKGLTIESIADVSRISAHTVVAHMKSIYRKLKVHSRGEAVFEAHQLGVLCLLLCALEKSPEVPAPPDPAGQPRFMNGDGGLTGREIEILLLICKGLTIESIAGVSQISAHTVVAHMKSIYRKLKVHSRGEAVFEARRKGLF